MTEWAKREERDTPYMAQREFRDASGRIWVGSITSGTMAGGEEHAEVILVCRDMPGELKRVARLESPPVEAARRWGALGERELRRILERSRPA